MTTATLVMLTLGCLAFVAGAALLFVRGGSDPAKVARRIAGAMLAALGLALTIFAIGLGGPAPEAS